ncbi:MAG: hypothetical protein ACLS3V_03285 [Streptococcus sp.]
MKKQIARVKTVQSEIK